MGKNYHPQVSLEHCQYTVRKKVPKDDSRCICFSIIWIVSVYKMGKNYHPQVFLEHCQYTVRKKVSRYISDDSKISFDDSDEEASDKSKESVFDK